MNVLLEFIGAADRQCLRQVEDHGHAADPHPGRGPPQHRRVQRPRPVLDRHPHRDVCCTSMSTFAAPLDALVASDWVILTSIALAGP